MDTGYRLDTDPGTVVDAVYLADDAVEEFLSDGPSRSVAEQAADAGLPVYFSRQTIDRLDVTREETSAIDDLYRVADQPYDERPMKRPERYDGESDMYNLAAVSRFSGEQPLLLSYDDDVHTAAQDWDRLTVLSPKIVVDAFDR